MKKEKLFWPRKKICSYAHEWNMIFHLIQKQGARFDYICYGLIEVHISCVIKFLDFAYFNLTFQKIDCFSVIYKDLNIPPSLCNIQDIPSLLLLNYTGQFLAKMNNNSKINSKSNFNNFNKGVLFDGNRQSLE